MRIFIDGDEFTHETGTLCVEMVELDDGSTHVEINFTTQSFVELPNLHVAVRPLGLEFDVTAGKVDCNDKGRTYVFVGKLKEGEKT